MTDPRIVGRRTALLLLLAAPLAFVPLSYHRRVDRVLVVYDMEGVAGVVNDSTMNSDIPASFVRGRESLIAEANAAVEALFDGGVATVEIVNSHGDMADSLVPRSRLDRRATIYLHGHPDPVSSRGGPRVAYSPADGLPQRGYSAVVVIGMHDRPRHGGFSPHVGSIGLTPVINHVPLTESDLVAYNFGTAGIPVILASGDDRLRVSLKATMPWVEYVETKRATGPVSVEPRNEADVVKDLHAGVARALARLARGEMHAVRFSGPTQTGVMGTYPMWVPVLMDRLPGWQRYGDTVSFPAANYDEAWRGITVLSALAGSNQNALIIGILNRNPAIAPAVAAARDSIWARWALCESGGCPPR
jgi:D-amino peptidase